LTKEQYGLWKHEPVTRWFFDYLIAKQAFLKTTAQEMWLNGTEPSQAIRGQIIELQEMIDLPFEAIEIFYQEKENDGTESESPVSPQG
jgi:hypothetical protein